ncbi:MAG: DUF1186 domain-containing protein [Candidatus Electrothrix sp. MAN1_4]|nr:DUF1186 domain-containing protein [Candidatus Electrothrix sp. MAN1_4]
MPQVFAMIGEPAIPALTEYVGDTSRTLYARSAAASSLSRIGKKHPKTRKTCIAGLEKALADYRQNDYYLNSSFVARLIELKAVEAFPTIQKAYQDDYVDLLTCGDLEDVEILLGLREKQKTERSDSPSRFSGYKRKEKKIGRNEPCPCGSGKKYKKCCINK